MNQKASDLGLSSTHFVSPHGLDHDDHFTTAYELAVIANYALQNKTFSKIVLTSSYTVNIDGKTKSLHNTNELLGYLDGVYGVKTGFTNGANRCLVTSCKRGNLDIICVVLGCDTKKDRTLDSIKIINYTFSNFSVINIKDIINKNFEDWKNEHQNSFNINKGISSSLELCLDESQIPFETIAVNNCNLDNITTPISFTSNFEAPLIEKTSIGQMLVNINEQNSFSISIFNKNTISKKNTAFYLTTILKNYFNYFNL